MGAHLSSIPGKTKPGPHASTNCKTGIQSRRPGDDITGAQPAHLLPRLVTDHNEYHGFGRPGQSSHAMGYPGHSARAGQPGPA